MIVKCSNGFNLEGVGVTSTRDIGAERKGQGKNKDSIAVLTREWSKIVRKSARIYTGRATRLDSRP